MPYYWIKLVHIGTVLFNIGFFCTRFYWMHRRPELVNRTWVRYLSWSNDSLLLLAGISLMMLSGQYPGNSPWLMAKLSALLLYILLGTLALTRGSTKTLRTICGLLALLSIGYMLSAAFYRTAEPWRLIGG